MASKMTKSAKGETCTVRFPGCLWGSETVIGAHIRRPWNAGAGKKPNDLHSVYACQHCHDVMDGRKRAEFSRSEIDSYLLDAHLRTLDRMRETGLI